MHTDARILRYHAATNADRRATDAVRATLDLLHATPHPDQATNDKIVSLIMHLNRRKQR